MGGSVVPRWFLPLILFLLPPGPYRAVDDRIHRSGLVGRWWGGGLRRVGTGPRENQSALSCPPKVRGRHQSKFYHILDG